MLLSFGNFIRVYNVFRVYLFSTFPSKSTSFPYPPSPFSPFPLLIYNQLHPIIAAMIHMGIGSSTGTWANY